MIGDKITAGEEVIMVAAECLHRRIVIYRNGWEDSEKLMFVNDSGGQDGPTIYVLFTGPWRLGHF